MSTQEDHQRQAVLAEAVAWLGTPYHHKAMLRGAGVDCAMFLVAVYSAAGLIPREIDIGDYPPDWMLHRDEERYLRHVLDYAVEVAAPLPGDLVVYKFGRTFSHGAIVLDWPRIIHAHYRSRAVVYGEGDQADLAERSRSFFTLKQWSADGRPALRR